MKRTFEAFDDNHYSIDQGDPRSFITDNLASVSQVNDDACYGTTKYQFDLRNNSVCEKEDLYRPRTPYPSQDEVHRETEPDQIMQKDFANRPGGLVDSNSLIYRQEFSICYGMLYRVNVKLLGDMSMVSAYLFDSDISQLRFHFLLDIIRSDDGHLFVSLANGLYVAEVNKKETEALSGLLLAKSAYLQALVDKRVLQSTIRSATKAKHATFAININVYGPIQSEVKVEVDIGSQLSDHKLWLQRPPWWAPGTTYRNPHYLRLDDEPSDAKIKSEALTTDTYNNDLQSSINDIFSMLTRESHLYRDAGDTTLHSPLLSHQEKALYFMTQREIGPIPSEFQSWEPVMQNDAKWYFHKVATKVKSLIQQYELGGGILADEMGMGKTFSTLALILTSLERARKWSQHEQSRLDDELPPSIILTHGTLVVVPSPLLLRTWTEEINKQITAPLRVLTYHGDKRIKDPRILLQYDIVVTTYHTLVSDHNRDDAVIRSIAWYRIVLDEAHFVRRSSSALFKRVDEIHAKFRWCLTGTPIQNHLEDIGTLFKFLRLYPFDRLGIFRQHISEPFRLGGVQRQLSRRALAKLLDFFSLRRTKDLLKLDHFSEEVRSIEMSAQERALYENVRSDMIRMMQNSEDEVSAHRKLGKFQVQLQLRLLCNHGTFQHRFHWHREETQWDKAHSDIQEDFLTLVNDGHDLPCSTCKDSLTSTELETTLNYRTCNKHVLCSRCQPEAESTCPLCEAKASRDQRSTTKANPDHRLNQAHYFKSEGHCTKMNQLVKDLQAVDPRDKSIVFSQWTTTLDLVAHHLQKHRIRFERVDGMHEFGYRQKILDQFKSDESLPVLIMTLGVGANGLDLTVANRVFMLEPQWNPSVELQAIGRTLRIGQEKLVSVIRYVTKNSVEDIIRHAQSQKLGMAAVSGALLDQYPADMMDSKN